MKIFILFIMLIAAFLKAEPQEEQSSELTVAYNKAMEHYCSYGD